LFTKDLIIFAPDKAKNLRIAAITQGFLILLTGQAQSEGKRISLAGEAHVN